jgi:magnesium-transporting ATPase (P-type)
MIKLISLILISLKKTYFSTGDILQADGLIIQSSDLKIDESSITGLL